VISDLERWGEWNPLFPEAEGNLSIGSLLTVRRLLEGKGERHEVRIVDWVPSAQIVWSRAIGPFARSLGYIEIEALSGSACILAAGEIFDGYLGQVGGKRIRRPLSQGFLALCEAAKAQAEATWDGIPDEAPPPPPVLVPPTPAFKTKPMQMSLRGPRR
jgi:hypothetical protein